MPVIVLMGENTFVIGLGMMAALPVTIITAMVSPIALPIPRIMAAVIPDRAEGTITLLIVCHLVAPIDREASRYSMGTELIASSDTLIIVGNAIIPRRIEPANQHSPDGLSNDTLNQSVNTINPKNP